MVMKCEVARESLPRWARFAHLLVLKLHDLGYLVFWNGLNEIFCFSGEPSICPAKLESSPSRLERMTWARAVSERMSDIVRVQRYPCCWPMGCDDQLDKMTTQCQVERAEMSKIRIDSAKWSTDDRYSFQRDQERAKVSEGWWRIK